MAITLPFTKLEKLTIIPYGQSEVQNGKPVFKAMDVSKKFTAMYNPTTLSVSNGQIVTEKKNIGDATAGTKVLTGLNSTFSVELFFDGTGTSVSGINGLIGAAAALKALAPGFVADQIKKFYETTLWFNKQSHESYYLHVSWGATFMFSCQLQSATTNYLMFNKQGDPIRATISASFIESADYSSSPDGVKGSFGLLSSDVTKLHTVKAGDTIYNIAKNEYDDESYYLKIAEINDLKNYRKLIPGQQLILPSVKQS